MRGPKRDGLARLAGEAGVIGKATAIWLSILAVLGLGIVDAVAIARTTLHLSEIATEAASNGAAAFRSQGRNEITACEVVAGSVEARDPSLKLGMNGCAVDATTGRVTVTLKSEADTIVAGRFGPTAGYTQVVVTESNGVANV